MISNRIVLNFQGTNEQIKSDPCLCKMVRNAYFERNVCMGINNNM